MFRIIHSQVASFLKAGKEVHLAEGAVELGASRMVAVVLALVGLAIAGLPLVLDFISVRVAARAQLVSLAAFALATKFWRGMSLRWLIGGFFRHWIPVGVLVHIYLVTVWVVLRWLKDGEPPDIAFHGGIMMMVLSFVAGVASWMHAKHAAQGAFRWLLGFYALLWLGFFLGGCLMLAMATGAADWFFEDLLGW